MFAATLRFLMIKMQVFIKIVELSGLCKDRVEFQTPLELLRRRNVLAWGPKGQSVAQPIGHSEHGGVERSVEQEKSGRSCEAILVAIGEVELKFYHQESKVGRLKFADQINVR